MSTNLTPAAEAIERAGGRHAVAQALGISYQAVYQWEFKQIPAERVPALAAMSGIPAELLRPDLYIAPRVREVEGA